MAKLLPFFDIRKFFALFSAFFCFFYDLGFSASINSDTFVRISGGILPFVSKMKVKRAPVNLSAGVLRPLPVLV